MNWILDWFSDKNILNIIIKHKNERTISIVSFNQQGFVFAWKYAYLIDPHSYQIAHLIQAKSSTLFWHHPDTITLTCDYKSICAIASQFIPQKESQNSWSLIIEIVIDEKIPRDEV